jgi:hypothetical protein
MSDDRLLNEILFDRLCADDNQPEWVDDRIESVLDRLYEGDIDFIDVGILADWLGDRALSGMLKAEAALRTLTPAAVRGEFKEITKEWLENPYRIWNFGKPKLVEARRRAARRVLGIGFAWYLARRATDAVNDFTRMKMREDGFYRRIMPPVPITNNEFDRTK